MDLHVSDQNIKLKKIFGIGPTGAIISIFLLIVSFWTDSIVNLSIITDYVSLVKAIGIVLILFGLGLHFWSFFTLRNWWIDDKLCTRGSFKYFRHPMYAAWITFICPGLALYLNSWLYWVWILSLHLLWHKLVEKEEMIMINTFGDTYKDYARRTGRFLPKI